MTLTDESSLTVPAITIVDTDAPPPLLKATHLFRRLDLNQYWDSEANTEERYLGDVHYQAYQSALSTNRARNPESFGKRGDPLEYPATFGQHPYEVYLSPLTEDHVPQIQDALEQVRTFLRFAKEPTSLAAVATVLAEKTKRAIMSLYQESTEPSNPEHIQSELSVLYDELKKFEFVANVYAPDRLTVNHTWETLPHIVKQSIEDLSESAQEVEADFAEVLTLLGFEPDPPEDSGEGGLREAMKKRNWMKRSREWGKPGCTASTRSSGSAQKNYHISKRSSRSTAVTRRTSSLGRVQR